MICAQGKHEMSPSDRHGVYNSCHPCRREYLRNWARAHYTKNRDKIKSREAGYRAKRRLLVIEGYGGKCSCSGCEERDYEALQLDHINNDGAAHRREIVGDPQSAGARTYTWALRQFEKHGHWPEILQLLCATCHALKTKLGSCPRSGVPHSVLVSPVESDKC